MFWILSVSLEVCRPHCRALFTAVLCSHSWTKARLSLLSHSPFNSERGVIGHTWRVHGPLNHKKSEYNVNQKSVIKWTRHNFPCRTKQLCQWATLKNQEQTAAKLLWDAMSNRVEGVWMSNISKNMCWLTLCPLQLTGSPAHYGASPPLRALSPPATGQPSLQLELNAQQHAEQMWETRLRLPVLLQ